MEESKVLFSYILYKLVEEFTLTEYYIKQLWVNCDDIIVIDKYYTNTDIEYNYGIHYIKVSLLLKNIETYRNNIKECILAKKNSVYVEVDIGTFDRIKFDVLEFLLECKIVSDNLVVKNKILNFNNLLIGIDLSKYSNIFVVSNNLDSEVYLKYLNRNCKKLCLMTTKDVDISVGYIDELSLIYNHPILFDEKLLNIDIYLNVQKLDKFLSLSSVLKEKKEEFNELKIYLDGGADIIAIKQFVNALNSLYGYFKSFKISSQFEYYYENNNFYKLSFYYDKNSCDWKTNKNIISLEDFAFEVL